MLKKITRRCASYAWHPHWIPWCVYAGTDLAPKSKPKKLIDTRQFQDKKTKAYEFYFLHKLCNSTSNPTLFCYKNIYRPNQDVWLVMPTIQVILEGYYRAREYCVQGLERLIFIQSLPNKPWIWLKPTVPSTSHRKWWRIIHELSWLIIEWLSFLFQIRVQRRWPNPRPGLEQCCYLPACP